MDERTGMIFGLKILIAEHELELLGREGLMCIRHGGHQRRMIGISDPGQGQVGRIGNSWTSRSVVMHIMGVSVGDYSTGSTVDGHKI